MMAIEEADVDVHGMRVVHDVDLGDHGASDVRVADWKTEDGHSCWLFSACST